MPSILYLVHNLSDPAVDRRVAMFSSGGADVQVAGFRRGDAPGPTPRAETVVELDITHDGRMLHRLAATMRAAWRANGWAKALECPDIIVARNLEMLAVAHRLRGVWNDAPVLVYEALDLHRLILRQDPLGQTLRALEQGLMRQVDALITSSPAFLRQHFHRARMPPAILLENKVFAPGLANFGRNPALTAPPAPIRIGWFGALRCRKSLAVLDAVSRSLGGALEVELRGRPALTAFEDFHATTAAAPHLTFNGPYAYPDDLAALYSRVHFVWAIDCFEEGLNSSWLLPNRLYEGCLNGAIPIALAGTETAAFLERLGIGVVIPDIAEKTVLTLLSEMTTARVRDLAGAVARQDDSLFRCDMRECVALVARLSELGSAPMPREAAA